MRELACCLLIALGASSVATAADSTLDRRNDRAVELLREARRADSPRQARQALEAALAELEHVLASAPDEAQRRRADSDRVVVLSVLGRDAKALHAYDDGLRRHRQLPSYVVSAAGDAAAAQGEPEKALDLYRHALQLDPSNDAAHAGRVFALADLDRLAEAQERIRERLARQHNRDDLLRLAMVRAWSGWPDDSAKQIDALAAGQPDDAELARQQAAMAMLQDRPYTALARYDRAMRLAPADLGTRLDRVAALDRLGRHRQAAQELLALREVTGPWRPLDRASDRRDADHGALIESRLRAGRGGDREIAAGETRHETTVWSPLFADRLRAFAAVRRAYADFRGTPLTDERWAAGLRWQVGALRLQFEVDDARDPWVESGGFGLSADWRASDDWSFSAAHAARAFDLPLRARGAGTTGDRSSLAARYSPREQLSARISVGAIDYSDGNRREDIGLSASWRQPLQPGLSLTLSPGLYVGRNRLDSVPYFSPLRDGSLEVAAALDHRLHARLSRRHEQRFEVFAGVYAQQGFDDALIGGARYQYAFTASPGRRWLARIARDRRSYDGRAEYQSSIELALEYRL